MTTITDTADTATVPWTAEQLESLNGFQACGLFHPFTCGNDHDGEDVLVATEEGWKCPSCSYRQDWAHTFMADGTWRKSVESRERLLARLRQPAAEEACQTS